MPVRRPMLCYQTRFSSCCRQHIDLGMTGFFLMMADCQPFSVKRKSMVVIAAIGKAGMVYNFPSWLKRRYLPSADQLGASNRFVDVCITSRLPDCRWSISNLLSMLWAVSTRGNKNQVTNISRIKKEKYEPMCLAWKVNPGHSPLRKFLASDGRA
jgi:hypothetical protein